MKNSLDVVSLINSLSPHEKSYFQKFSNIYNKNDKIYLHLFEQISKMKHYDESILKSNFESVYASNFGMLKEQLYEKILMALVMYNKELNVENLIFKWVEEGKVLQRKGLLKQANKKFKKALDYSIKYERFYLVLNIFSHLKAIVIHNLYENIDIDDINDLLKNEEIYIEVIVNLQKLNNSQFMYYYYESKSNDQAMQKIANSDLIQDWERYPTFVEKSICLNILSHNYENLQDYEKSLNFLQKHIELFECNLLVLKEYYFNYLLQKFNYISLLIKINSIEEAKKIIQDFELIKPKKQYHKLFFSLYYSNLLLIDCLQIRFNDFLIHYNEMNLAFNSINQKCPTRMYSMVNYYKVVLCFNNNEFKLVLKDINIYINQTTNDDSLNTSFIILAVLCFIELRDFHTLKMFLVSFKKELKYLKKQHSKEFFFINRLVENAVHEKLDSNFMALYEIEVSKINKIMYPFDLSCFIHKRGLN